jgi:hypothetical protein
MKLMIIFAFCMILSVTGIIVYEDVQETHLKQESKCP